MVSKPLVYDDTSVEIKDKSATAASSEILRLAELSWPLAWRRRDPVVRLEYLNGLILKWQEQKLNLDFDAHQRCYFFSFAKALEVFVDEIQKEIIILTGYEQRQLDVSTSFPVWEQQLEELRLLPDDWDSYGASRITDEAIEMVTSILSAVSAAGLSQQFFVVPCPDGGIQIEWDLPDKEMVLEIPPTGELSTFLLVETTATGEEAETEGTIQETEGFEQLLWKMSG